MELLWGIAIFVVLNLVECENFYISINQSIAQHARQLCELATPPLTSSEEGYTIPYNPSSVPENVWVGHIKRYQALTYRGCAQRNSIGSDTMKNIKANISHCNSFCSTQSIFGIGKHGQTVKCYCMNTLPNSLTTGCDINCLFPTNTWCGGSNLVSIYEKEQSTEIHDLEGSESITTLRIVSNLNLLPRFKALGDRAVAIAFSAYSRRPHATIADLTTTIPHGSPVQVTDVHSIDSKVVINMTSGNNQVEYPTTNCSQDNVLGHCLVYEPLNKYLFWSSCTTDYRRICYDTNRQIIISNSSSAWSKAMSDCLSSDHLPVGHSANFAPISNSGPPIWLATIWIFSVSSISDVPPITADFQLGYTSMEEIDNRRKVTFCPTNDSLRALCLNESSTATPLPSTNTQTKSTPTSSTSSSVLVTTTTESTKKPTNTTVSQTVESTDRTATSTSGDFRNGTATEASTGKDSSKVGVYVGVPLGLLFVVLVTVFIVWITRSRCSNKKFKPDEINGHGIPRPLTNAAYVDSTTLSSEPGATNHDYFELEPANEYAAIKDTDIDIVDNDEYDNTGAVKANGHSGVAASGNIYNKLEDVTGDTYNHCSTDIIRNDETYNHTEGIKTQGIVGNPNGMTNNPNETYSHLDGISPNGKTSNNLPVDSITDNTEDTYDHTSGMKQEQPRNSTKPSVISNPITKSTDTNTRRPNYDYAYATKGDQNGASNPGMFTLSQLPGPDNYDFAKEPPTTVQGYELANFKQTPDYIELKNE